MTSVPDPSVYPDVEPPRRLVTREQKADYLLRVLGAFDFGIPPDEATLRLLSHWQKLFDQFPVLGSPAYHALRAYFAWQELPRKHYFSEPAYLKFDRLEGRVDGFEHRV